MKLRLRSLQSKQTLKIEVPNPCTLQQLNQTLSQALSYSSPSLHLSLNRKDELHASSPQDSLQSLGITSGDLIYFSLNPHDFSSSPNSSSFVQAQTQPQQGNLEEPTFNKSMYFSDSENLGLNMDGKQETFVGSQASEVNCGESRLKENEISQIYNCEWKMSDSVIGENSETHEFASVEGMDVDTDAGSLYDVSGKRFSEPYFLRRVLREEFGGGGKSKLLIIALHAVFLESGFVGFDLVSGRRLDRFNFPEEWPSRVFRLSLWYTLPELLGDENENENVAESVVLRFQSLGHFVNVYGCLSKGGSGPYSVCLNEDRFAPIINVVWANCEKDDRMNGDDKSASSYSESEVLEFWKIVKDGLALPLLIDLCDKTGLALPSCLMRLPTELKFKILDSLPAIGIARMGCVCSEMRYLSSTNDLWKRKFEEEFGSGTGAQGIITWKERFASWWEMKKKQKEINSRQTSHQVYRPFCFSIRRDPDPLRFPSPIIGGDYDRFPALGAPLPLRRPSQTLPRFRTTRNFAPNCNLGGA